MICAKWPMVKPRGARRLGAGAGDRPGDQAQAGGVSVLFDGGAETARRVRF